MGLLSPNFDKHAFPDGDDLDVRREAKQHVAFGYGIHQCIGQVLARLELEIALASLLTRFPALRFAQDPDSIPFRSDNLIYGPHRLPIAWSAD